MEQAVIDKLAKDQINNQKWQDYMEYMAELYIQNGICEQITFELTSQCTLKCKMCFVRMDKSQCDAIGTMRTAKEWIELARQFRDAGGLTILLTGGEAMMRPDFLTIYDAISRMGLMVTVFTNGTTITDEVMDMFTKRPPALIGLTLYGASEETYERTCGWGGGFQKAFEGLDRLLTIPNLNMDVRFTACSLNYQDFDKLKQMVEQRGKLLSYDFGEAAYVRGAFSDVRKLRLTEEQKDLIRKSMARSSAPVLDSMHKYLSTPTSTNASFEESSSSKSFAEPLEDRTLKCRAGLAGVYVAWDGRMYPCDMMSAPYAYPFRDGFLSSYKEIRNKLDTILVPEKCANCKNRISCGPCAAKHISELEACSREGVACNFSPIICG